MKMIPLALSVALLAPAIAFASVSEEVEYNFDVSSGSNFKLENVNGDIDITAWDQNSINVIAIKTADNDEDLERIEIVIDESSNGVRIDTKHHKSAKGSGWFNWNNNDSGEVKYTVKAPRDLELRLVDTVNGNVTIEGIAADVKAETVNGDIEISGLAGDASLETVNGDIEAQFLSFGESQNAKFDTVNGAIKVYLPQDVSARVSADTVNGSIKNDFGLKVEKGFVTRELDGQLGNGGGRMSFETVNGSIQIRSN